MEDVKNNKFYDFSMNDLKKIAYNALKRLNKKGYNKHVNAILEGLQPQDLEDLAMEIYTQKLENSHKTILSITCDFLYKNNKRNNRFSIDFLDDFMANDTNFEYNYLKYELQAEAEPKTTQTNTKILKIKELNLTKKQLEILNIYSKTNSLQKTANYLNIAKSTVSTTIKRIQNKANDILYI